MCGRYILTSPIDDLAKMFGVETRANIPPRYNIAPRQPVLVVRQGDRGARELAATEWGLVPEWALDIGTKPLINARLETVTAKPSFRGPIKRTRCLVPMNGWYEWKSEHGNKQPYLITPTDGALQAFAGIWTTWHGPGGDNWLETVAILTAPAEGPLRTVHHRRPLVVDPAEYDTWLTPTDPLPRDFLATMRWTREQDYHTRPVSRRVNSVQFDESACLNPPEDIRQGSLF